jgi:glycosyltransferase involved in cell wall biosynthesis
MNQPVRDLELIVVDQNDDSCLQPIVEKYSTIFPTAHLTVGRGLSRARNIGLRHATGDVIAFPDDDCWYPDETLGLVERRLREDPALAGVTGRSVSPSGSSTSGRWEAQKGLVTRANAFRRAISFTIFLRRSAVLNHSFDETLGLGAQTPWGAGEETDYLLQVIDNGGSLLYDPELTVFHPPVGAGPYDVPARRKARSYGRGMGRVLRKHSYPLARVAYHLARPVLGAALAVLCGRPSKAAYHLAVFTGRLEGWLHTGETIVPPALNSGSTRI